MRDYLKSIGAHFICMEISNYKNANHWRAVFHTPQYKRELESSSSVARDVWNPHVGYVALSFPNHNIIDVDWKDDFVPSAKQATSMASLKKNFPWYPSMTKQVHGCHIIVPKERFKNCPSKGDPRMLFLCDVGKKNIVEVLTQKPPILKLELFSKYKIPNTTMSPPMLDFYEYSPPSLLVKETENRAVENIAVEPKQVTFADDKPNAELRKYLALLSDERADDYEMWLKVTRVSKMENDKSAWQDFSKRSAKYNADENERIWNSVHDSRVTLGTIKHWAREDSPRELCSYADVKKRFEKDGYAELYEGATLLRGKVELSEQAFKRCAAQYRYFDPKDEKMKSLYPRWIADEERRVVTRLVFRPYNPLQENTVLDTELNTAPPFKFEYIENYDPEPLADFRKLCRAMCSTDSDAEWLLSFFAHMLQHPSVNPQTLVVIKGSMEGAGKDTLCKTMAKLLGETYFSSVDDPSLIFGGFNGPLSHKILVQMNECQSMQTRTFWPNIKQLVTVNVNMINEKYSKPREQANCVRIVMCSNEMNPSDVGRRPFITNVSYVHKLPKTFFQKWYAGLESQEFLNNLASGLLNVELLDVTTPPLTRVKEIKEEEKIYASHRLFQNICTGKVRGEERNCGMCFKFNDLLHEYTTQLEAEQCKDANHKKVKKMLTDVINEFNEVINRNKLVKINDKVLRMVCFEVAKLEKCLKEAGKWSTPELLEELGL